MPTMKEIAEALHEAGNLYLLMWQDAEKYEDEKTSSLWKERYEDVEQLASKVEQMQCETCWYYDEQVHGTWEDGCNKGGFIVQDQGPNFGCCHWKEKEVKNG